MGMLDEERSGSKKEKALPTKKTCGVSFFSKAKTTACGY
jgi:hypothetical protein